MIPRIRVGKYGSSVVSAGTKVQVMCVAGITSRLATTHNRYRHRLRCLGGTSEFSYPELGRKPSTIGLTMIDRRLRFSYRSPPS